MRIIPDLPGSGSGEKIDYQGAFLLMASLTATAFAMSMGRGLGLESPPIITSILVSLGCGIAFISRERRISKPLVDLEIFRKKCFLYANMASMMSMLVFAGAMFLLPFFLQVWRGYSADVAGLILMTPPLAMIDVAFFGAIYSANLPKAAGGASHLGIAASAGMASAFHSSFSLGVLFGLLMLTFTVMGLWRGCYVCPNSVDRTRQIPA